MIEDIIKFIENRHYVTLREIELKFGIDRDYLLYLIRLVNKNREDKILIRDSKIIRPSGKCKNCPYFKS
ncbi:MAG: hypothetical protein R6U31_01295 [bacterium]